MPIDVTPLPVTAEQEAHALLAQSDLVEYFNRQLGEGMDYRVLLAGLGAATTALVVSQLGANHVPAWFAQMAVLTRDEGPRQEPRR